MAHVETLEQKQVEVKPARFSLRPLANRNFRLVWIGEHVSLLGDQFYLIALPWLVFQLTGSSLAFGTVLMVSGIPRAVFMLIGGAMTDRFSPRTVMVISNLLRLAITALLTVLVAGQNVQLWMIYLIAFCFGLVDAFFHPAYMAMIPLIVEKEDLQASNSLNLAATELVSIAGPGIAGAVVNVIGVAVAFAFDAITFLFTSILLSMMRPPALPKREANGEDGRRRGILPEIGEMLAYVWRDPVLRALIVALVAINFLFVGPLLVGTAALGKDRFAEGSAAFGVMLAAFGVGSLIGMLSAGVLHPRYPGLISLILVGVEGLLMIGIAFTESLVVACGLWMLIGIGAGFGNVNVVTLTQKIVPQEMMGRFMSLIMLAQVGLTPLSNGAAGVLAEWSVTGLFVLAGGALTLTLAVLLVVTDRKVWLLET